MHVGCHHRVRSLRIVIDVAGRIPAHEAHLQTWGAKQSKLFGKGNFKRHAN